MLFASNTPITTTIVSAVAMRKSIAMLIAVLQMKRIVPLTSNLSKGKKVSKVAYHHPQAEGYPQIKGISRNAYTLFANDLAGRSTKLPYTHKHSYLFYPPKNKFANSDAGKSFPMSIEAVSCLVDYLPQMDTALL
jgi:hypothetical protein